MAETTQNISRNIIAQDYDGICFGDVLYKPRGQYGPVVQPNYQLVLMIDGGVDLRISGEWQRVSSGQVALLRPGQPIFLMFEREQPTRHQWCTAPASSLSSSLQTHLEQAAGSIAIPETLHTIMRVGLQNASSHPELHHSLHRSLAESAFQIFWMAQQSGIKNHSSASESLLRVQRFIHEHHAEPITLADLSKRAALSPNHLIRLFREHFSETPMDFLWRIRVEKGATWLRETGLGVSEIAYRAGFQNPFHFSRRFKQHYGKSPRTFRESGN